MPLFIGKFRTHKRPHQILREGDANNARSEHKHIHIVVLDALMRRISVMAYSRANAGKLVGRDAGADAAAADEDATLCLLYTSPSPRDCS